MSDGERWAIYFAPPREHALWATACRWLGRDPESGAVHAAPSELSAELWDRAVATPRHYGLHATLKPPFRLRCDVDAARLMGRMQRFAEARGAFHLPPLRLGFLGSFLALLPSRHCPAMDALAADCVRCFDGLRAPMTTAEYRCRHPERLTARQRRFVEAWGYPYVFDEYRFHLTLTGAIDDNTRESCHRVLTPLLADATASPVPVDALCLYRETAGRPFELVRRYPLTGRERDPQRATTESQRAGS